MLIKSGRVILVLKKAEGKGEKQKHVTTSAGRAGRSLNTAPQLVSSSVIKQAVREIDRWSWNICWSISVFALPSVIHNNKSLHVKKSIEYWVVLRTMVMRPQILHRQLWNQNYDFQLFLHVVSHDLKLKLWHVWFCLNFPNARTYSHFS